MAGGAAICREMTEQMTVSASGWLRRSRGGSSCETGRERSTQTLGATAFIRWLRGRWRSVDVVITTWRSRAGRSAGRHGGQFERGFLDEEVRHALDRMAGNLRRGQSDSSRARDAHRVDQHGFKLIAPERRTIIAMKFTIERDIGLSFLLQAALTRLVTDRETKTHRRGGPSDRMAMADAALRARKGNPHRRRCLVMERTFATDAQACRLNGG
jgi:hypothetical protein